MERFLSLLEKPPPEVAIDEEKLNFFISKVTIWDYFSLSEQIYKSSSVEEKTSLLNKYYRELYEKYYGVCNFVFFFNFLISKFCAALFLVSDNKFKVVMLPVIGPVNSSNDNSISDAIKRSGDISLTKNIALPERNTETTIAATRFENGHVKNTTCV